MPRVQIRPSRIEDIAAMQTIEASAAELFRGTGLIDLDDMGIHGADEHRNAIDSNMSFLAEVDGAAAGFVMGEAFEGNGYLHELDVDLAHQRTGIGAKLVEAFCAHCKLQRLSSVYLSTFRAVAWNAPYYARLGFEEVHRDDYLPRMVDIETKQAASLDISKRLFMRRGL